MPPRFPSISLVPGGATQAPSSKAEWGKIKGKLPDQSDLAAALMAKADLAVTTPQLEAINQALGSLSAEVLALNTAGINRRPTVQAAISTLNETDPTISGNILAGASDADGDPMVISSISYGGSAKTLGVQFATTYGHIAINANGAYTFAPGSSAWALRSGQTAAEVFSFNVYDGQGGNRVSTLSITVIGSDTAPRAVADFNRIPFNTTINFNVLANDTNADGGPMSVVSYTVDTIDGTFAPGEVRTIPSVGNIVINSDGSGSFTPQPTFSGIVPEIGYALSNGYLTDTGVLQLNVSSPAAYVASNPVTYEMTGDRTFNVGPGKEYLELDTVPWATLQAGDVVNIFWRSTPYVCKFGISARGTALKRVFINGVTDSSGNRPTITGIGARTASGSMISGHEVFGSLYQSTGVVVVQRPPGVSETLRPCFITIQNLRVMSARLGETTYFANGSAETWGDFAASIAVKTATDVDIINNICTDSGLGLFTDSHDGGVYQGSERFRVLYNRFYGNGIVGDSHQHNVYHQVYDTIIEGNYFGPLRDGALGAAYKSRSGKEVIRFNWIEGKGSLLDIVQADNYFDGMVTMPDYGKTWAYGNVLITADEFGGVAYRIVHFGGDNQGEQDADFPLFDNPANYRTHLYFWNNTVISKTTSTGNQYLLKLSSTAQVCDWWNNIVYQPGSRFLHIMHYAGTLNLRGYNLFYSPGGLDDHAPETNGAFMTINRLGTVLTTNPNFANASFFDLIPAAGSPALNLYSGPPAGIDAGMLAMLPLELEPAYRTNGNYQRGSSGLVDIGAFEYVPGAPVRSAPVLAVQPTVTTSALFRTGCTMHVSDGSWMYSPTSIAFQWQVSDDSGVTWSNVTGATSSDLVAPGPGDYRAAVSATNVVGTTMEYSISRTVSDAPNATIAQHAAGTLNPSGTSVQAAFSAAPVAGNTIAVFATGADSISDNYGHTWTQAKHIDPVYYDADIADNLWVTTVVTSSGSGAFTVTATGTVTGRQTALMYEVVGTLDQTTSFVGEWSPASGSINITSTGELVIASNHYGSCYAVVSYPTLETPPWTFSQQQPDGYRNAQSAYVANAVSSGAMAINQGPLLAGHHRTIAASFLPL